MNDEPFAGSAAAADAFVGGVTAREALRVEGDLRQFALRFPTLLRIPPIEPVPSQLSLAIAFGAPGYTADQLRAAARTSLWIFAVDFQVDHLAASAGEVAGIVERCEKVADGGSAAEGDALCEALACLREDLSAAPAFGDLEPVWLEELHRMLQAMALEWNWKDHVRRTASADQMEQASGQRRSLTPPTTLEDYLVIADNFGSAWVNVVHWIALDDPVILEHLPQLREASRTVQSALRLLNDLATSGREAEWDDLNALRLGADEVTVRLCIDDLVRRLADQLDQLRATCPHGAAYLEHQLKFSQQFYGAQSDYWGDLPNSG
ncbi:terpene synthase family protein [Actinomadura napierensis]|uniref:Terpene synthase n=1 Tax=Actinomadura napierensis TaxID=267854 RepID=A0ABP5MA49_9ACTN